MNLSCNPSPFDTPVNTLLRTLSQVNFFEHSLLVGSWPMVVYAQIYGLIYGLRTNDIDFAIVEAVHKRVGTRLPDLLEKLGYELLIDYKTGAEKYVQDSFEVEFLMHRRGGTAPPVITLPAWQVAAQPLPFIDILFLHPVSVEIEDYLLRIPSPEALLVHKLIVAQRRTGKNRAEKREKDLQQCSALAEIVRGEEVQLILKEKRMSKAVHKDIITSCREAGLNMGALNLC